MSNITTYYCHLCNILFLAILLMVLACTVNLHRYKDYTSAVHYDINNQVVKDIKVGNEEERMNQIQKDLLELGKTLFLLNNYILEKTLIPKSKLNNQNQQIPEQQQQFVSADIPSEEDYL